MPEISIIVPVYNVEKYLKKCVDSILAQTFQNFELILVDDGSWDGCGDICDSYQRQDFRVRVIHKPNGGLSDARNAGIDAAQGRYLGFIDSDDYISEDMYEMLHRLIVQENADVAACSMYHCYYDHIEPPKVPEECMVVDSEQAIAMMLESKKVSVNAVNKLYKREMFHKVRYPVGKLSEDAFVVVELFAQAKKVVISTVPKYYYVHHEGTITSSPFREKDLNVIEAYTKNLDLVSRYFPALKERAMFRYYFAHFYVLDKMVLSSEFDDFTLRKKIIKTLKNNFIGILKNPYVGRNRKIAMCGLMVHLKIYKRLVSLNRNVNRKLVG